MKTSIIEHGASTELLNTGAIQNAIDFVHDAGGGTVVVPPGEWLSGTIMLKSGVTLFLESKAILKGSPNIADYAAFEGSSGGVYGKEMAQGKHRVFLGAENAENIKVTGGGTIDGNGHCFWDEPLPGTAWYRPKQDRVTPMIEFRGCHKVTLEDIQIRNSPGWTLHPFNCEDVTLRCLRLNNHLRGPNTDGIDINGCRDVFISDCRITTGDDAIVIKASHEAQSSERIVITNCILKTNCIALGIGCETSSSVRQVTISNCVAHQCHRIFGVGMWEGGVVEDITVVGLVGDTIGLTLARPIAIDIKENPRAEIHMGRKPGKAILRNLQISNFIAKTEGRILLTAQQGLWLDGVVLRDIRLCYPSIEDPVPLLLDSVYVGDNNQYSGFNLVARKQRAAVIVENARNFILDGLYIAWPENNKDSRQFSALWLRNVSGGIINIPPESDGREPDMILENAVNIDLSKHTPLEIGVKE